MFLTCGVPSNMFWCVGIAAAASLPKSAGGTKPQNSSPDGTSRFVAVSLQVSIIKGVQHAVVGTHEDHTEAALATVRAGERAQTLANSFSSVVLSASLCVLRGGKTTGFEW